MADRTVRIAILLSAIDRASGVIRRADAAAKSAFKVGKNAAIGGAILAAPLIFATEKAIAFEDKMADVSKAFNTEIGSSKFIQMGEQAKDLSEYLSKGAEESAALMASLGQGGVDQSNLAKVSSTAGEMAVAFDLTADIAGDRYTKLKNALNSSWDDTAKLGDAINFLSDNQASKASEILEFMAAGGAGVAKAARAGGQDLAAMGSYLISVGKSGAESATIMDRFYKGIMKNKGTRADFTKAGSGTDGFLSVLQKGANIQNEAKRFDYFKQFGEYGSDIMAMAGNMDLFRASIKSVSKEQNYLGSVNKEFLNRNSTTQGKINKAWASFNRVVLDFGAHGIPIVLDLLNTLKPIVASVSAWMNNNKGLTGTLFQVIAAGAALSFGVSALAFVFGGYMKVVVATTTVLRWLRTGYLAYQTAMVAGTTITGGFRAAMVALNLTLLMNPIVLIVAAVVALIAGLVIAYMKCEKFRAVMDGVFEVGKMLFTVFSALGKIIKATFTFDLSLMKEGMTDMGKLVMKIKDGGIQKAFNKGYDKSIEASKKAAAANKANGASDSMIPGMPSMQSAPAPSAIKQAPAITFAPVINLNGSANKNDGQKITSQIKTEFDKLMKEYQAKQRRVSYE